MLDIVAPHDDELALRVEREHVDHAEPRRPAARAAGNSQAIRENQPIQADDDAGKHKHDHTRAINN